MQWDWLIAELPQLHLTACQAPGADQQRKTSVAFHKPHVCDASCRQLKRRRLSVTVQEKPSDGGTADLTAVSAVGTPLQLHLVALQRRRDQSVASSNQDAAIPVSCYVGDIHTRVAYVRQWRLFHQKLIATGFRQSNSSLDNHIIIIIIISLLKTHVRCTCLHSKNITMKHKS